MKSNDAFSYKPSPIGFGSGAARTNRPASIGYALAVAALSLLAAALYAYRLGMQSFWFDEAASFVNASLPPAEFGVAMRHRDAFFAAYYALLHGWSVFFGTSEAMLRLPSVIGAVVAIPCMFVLGRRLYDERVGLIAAALLASNNLFILHVREARPYAWLVLFAIVSSLTFIRAWDSGKASAWGWYVVASVVGAYVHVFALLVPFSHAAWMLFARGERPIKAFAFALAGIALGVAPLLALILGQESSGGRAFAGHGNPRDLIYLFRIFCGSKASAVVYATLGVFAYATRSRAQAVSRSYEFLACWMLTPPLATLIVSHFVPLFLETYLLVSLPPLLLLVACCAAAALRDARVLTAAGLLFVLLNLPETLKTYGEHGMKEDWRGAVAAAIAGAGKNGALAAFPATDAASLAYYEKGLDQRRLPKTVYPAEASYRIWLPAPAVDTPEVRETVRRRARIIVLVNQDAPEAEKQAASFAAGPARAFALKETRRFTNVLLLRYERAP